jgi:phosphatidylinositol alpha-mannosyltransferase
MREVWRRRGSIIPNPAQCVEPAALRSKGTSSQSSRVVFLGRLVARKGADHLLDAVESLPLETMSQLSVIVVGDGPLRRRLQRRVAASSTLRNVVSFSGYVSEAAKWHLLSEADIAVFPATGAESFGMVLLEAMVADCAIVAYANDGYAFVLRGVPSALVPSASTTSLAERIRLLHHSPTERMRQVSEQRKALPQYDVAEIGRQYLELYAASRH